MRVNIRSLFVDFLASTLGKILVTLNPKKVSELSDKGLTLVIGNNLSISERLMRRAILKKIENKEDFDRLAEFHKTYWTKQGNNFVNNTQNKLENIHIPAYKNTLNLLINRIKKSPIKFNRLVEIGTGNGSVLNHLSLCCPEIDQMIGIDLSKQQTKINTVNYKDNQKLKFVDGDIVDWIKNQKQGNLVFLTFRGVLEYFSQYQLAKFLKTLSAFDNVLFFAIEPIDSKHDYSEFPESKVYGVEGSFSHNYPKLFEEAGFEIWHLDKKEEIGSPNIMSVVGAKNF